MIPSLARIAVRLASSPLPARMLALGGMLSTLTMALAVYGLAGASIWDARIGLLLGGGAALLVLPKWIGWPNRTLAAVVLLGLTIGLASNLFLTLISPVHVAQLLGSGQIWLAVLLASCVVLLLAAFLRGPALLVGTLASVLAGLLVVSLGIVCVCIGAIGWVDLSLQASSSLPAILLLAWAVWISALFLSQLEKRRPYQWGGRLLAWRSVLLRQGGAVAGVGAGLSIVSTATDAIWAVAFDTPFESLTNASGYVIGSLSSLLIVIIFALLPRLMARLQLSGNLAASAAAESGWFAALTLVATSGWFAVSLADVSLLGELFNYFVPIVLATLAHSAIRLLLGRVPKQAGVPLWVFLPEGKPELATLACAARIADCWRLGPVFLVAPPPVALKVHGAHLSLAQHADLLEALFVQSPSDVAISWRMRLAPELAWNGLPFGELYGGREAWEAALAKSQGNARRLVIVGRTKPRWEAAFFKALPRDSELLYQHADGVPPPTTEGVLRNSVDLTHPSVPAAWLARNTPVPRAKRRILVLHDTADASLARRFAQALDGMIDATGRQTIASALDTRAAGPLLHMNGRTVETVAALAARSSVSPREVTRATLFGRVVRLVAGCVAAVTDAPIHLAVLESSEGWRKGPSPARGLESKTDSVVSLLPAGCAVERTRLYAWEAYAGVLSLPPPSAQDEGALVELAQRLLAALLQANTGWDPPPVPPPVALDGQTKVDPVGREMGSLRSSWLKLGGVPSLPTKIIGTVATALVVFLLVWPPDPRPPPSVTDPRSGGPLPAPGPTKQVPGAEKPRVHPPGETFRDCDGCPEMIVVPEGRFVMGSDAVGLKAERPEHEVSIAQPFAVGKYEVTFDEWDACVAAGGCQNKPADEGWGRGRRPVINVSWYDAQSYVAWLAKRAGQGYRLLSEAEWEYATRAGTTTAYPWGNEPGRGNANFILGVESSGKQTSLVGSFAPNRFQLHDMIANVGEWTEDCWNRSYAGAPDDGSPWLQGDCSNRVVRGGSWSLTPGFAWAAFRSRYPSGNRSSDVGFRVAKTL